MSLNVNGTNIPDGGNIFVNGTKPAEIKVNGVVAWIDKTYTYTMGVGTKDVNGSDVYGYHYYSPPAGTLVPNEYVAPESTSVIRYIIAQNGSNIIEIELSEFVKPDTSGVVCRLDVEGFGVVTLTRMSNWRFYQLNSSPSFTSFLRDRVGQEVKFNMTTSAT